MPIITISRGSLSGGNQLAQKLGETLGFKVVSQGELGEAATRYEPSAERITAGLERPGTLWERLTHQKERYLLAAQTGLMELLGGGDGVFHGHAGQFLLKDLPNVVKVRLIAPMEYRIKAAMRDRGLSYTDAAKHIAEVDLARLKWVRQLYGVDWNDSGLYDLVINLAHMSVDSAAELVAELVAREEFRNTEETLQRFADLRLAARVRAQLVFKSAFAGDAVEVQVTDGVVHLAGGPGFEEHRSQIIATVQKVPGVTKVFPEGGDAAALETPRLEEGGLASHLISEIMLPPEKYPQVYRWVSVRDAIVALSASAVRLADEHFIPPRYVLVLDTNDRLVGIVNRRNLIRGLDPHRHDSALSQTHRSVVSPYGGGPDDMLTDWTSLFTASALEAAERPVENIMEPIKGSVRVDDTISTVVTTMLRHDVDLIPVVEGDRVAGVVLMTDVFDLVAQFIMEEGGVKKAARS